MLVARECREGREGIIVQQVEFQFSKLWKVLCCATVVHSGTYTSYTLIHTLQMFKVVHPVSVFFFFKPL